MDLNLTAEERAFQLKVRAWIAENLPPDIAERSRSGKWHTKNDHQCWARILGQRGWHGYGWPKEYGGPGWTPIQKHLFTEECAMAGAPTIIPFGPIMVAPVIMAFGTSEQKARHLPGIMTGDVWWCQGYSEPGSGSDLASLKTRAERRGDSYVVNGQKTWTSYAHDADWIFALVRTSPNAKPQAGISFLLMDMKSSGITVRPIITMDGQHVVNDVFFDDVVVPAENLIGEQDKGWTYAKHLLAHERTFVANVSRAKYELRRLKQIAQATGVWDESRFRDQIALLEVDIVALEMMVLRVLAAEQGNQQALDVTGLLKIAGSEIEQRYTELMLFAGGPSALPLRFESVADPGKGTTEWAGTLASKYFNSRKTTIYGGSNEVQRNIVAQSVLDRPSASTQRSRT